MAIELKEYLSLECCNKRKHKVYVDLKKVQKAL